MNIEELQEKFEELASEMDWIKTKLVDLLEKKGLAPVKTPYEVEVPEDIGDYVFVTESGNIKTIHFSPRTWTEEVYRSGLLFKTEEEAEKYDKERILLFKLHKWAEEHNGGWKPDLNDYNEKKYFVEYNSYYEPLEYNYCRTLNFFSKLPYFKSEEIVKQFIEEFGEEIKEVLC